MGLGELMGIKTIKLNIKGTYTIDEFYERIKDVDFRDAGKPGLYKHGGNRIIAFPKIDRENQVWILQDQMGKNKGSFSVVRSVTIASEHGLMGALANSYAADVQNDLTFGISGAKSAFGSPKKKCMQDVETVAECINKLGL